MNPPVEQAIDEIRKAFPGCAVDIESDGAGGAFVRVHRLSFGPLYEPEIGWVAFHIPFNCPHPDIYPHWLPDELRRKDDKPLGEAFHKREMQLGTFNGPATMVSRRSTKWNPAHDTAALKLAKILDWIRSRT